MDPAWKWRKKPIGWQNMSRSHELHVMHQIIWLTGRGTKAEVSLLSKSVSQSISQSTEVWYTYGRHVSEELSQITFTLHYAPQTAS